MENQHLVACPGLFELDSYAEIDPGLDVGHLDSSPPNPSGRPWMVLPLTLYKLTQLYIADTCNLAQHHVNLIS